MELKITSKKENALLDRTDVTFEVVHQGEKTPQRGTVRDQLAAQLGAKVDLVVVDHMSPEFGRQATKGLAKVYANVEKARYHERDYLLKRNKLFVEKPKKEQKAPAEAEKKKEKARPAAKKGA